MKKLTFVLFCSCLVNLLFAQNSPDTSLTKFGWEFKLGVGPTFLSNIDGVKAEDIYLTQVGLAQQYGVDLFYNLRQGKRSNLRLTTGYGIMEFQGTVYTNATTKYDVSNLYHLVPLKFTFDQGLNKNIRYYSGVGLNAAFPIAARAVMETLNNENVSRQLIESKQNQLYLSIVGGLRIKVNETISFAIGAESISVLNGKNKSKDAALIFSQGVSFNF